MCNEKVVDTSSSVTLLKDAPPGTCGIVRGHAAGHLLETIIRPGGEAAFAVRFPDGHIETRADLLLEGTRFVPLAPQPSLLRNGIVYFPPQVGALLSASMLMGRIQALIHKYVDVSEFFEHEVATYVLYSWFYDTFRSLPYLRVRGDAGTGKTRFLEVVGALCYRPIFVNGGTPASAIFNLANIFRGTLVLDAVDHAPTDDESAEITRMLRVGNQRQQGRVIRGDPNAPDEDLFIYNVYGPKLLSTRQQYQGHALEARCLSHQMQATTRTDIPRNLPDSFWDQEVPELQAQLLSYRLAHFPAVSKRSMDLAGFSKEAADV